jgi:histidine ammonia-lyase
MSMAAAIKAGRALDLARQVVAIELLCACQALDLLRPLASSAPLMRVLEHVRSRVPTLDEDRAMSAEIETIAEMIASSDIERACAVKVN